MAFNLSAEQLAALEGHIGAKAKAYKTHEKFLGKEISKGAKKTAFHTMSRHGYQTGWEAQLIRLMTGETPDQPFALNGVRGTILQWATPSGQRDMPARTRNVRYAEADSVGAFLSPEVAVAAINAAAIKTTELRKGVRAQMTARGNKTWVNYDYIEIITRTPFEICGISFVRDQSKKKRDKAEFEEALKDYWTGALGPGKNTSLYDEMQLRAIKASGSEIPPKLLEKLVTRFPNLSDLLDFLHVKAVSMKYVRLVLKRVSKNRNDWRLHTAYCVNGAPMMRPDAPGQWDGQIEDENGFQPSIAKVIA
jgi:hypothetical protein